MRTGNAHRLCEPYLLRAQLPWHGKAELGIVPAIIKVVVVVVTVGGRCLVFKRCCRIGDNLRVLLPAFADGDQIGSGEALRAVFGLGLCDELVKRHPSWRDRRHFHFLGDDSGDCYCVVFARGIGEEGEVCVNELLERHEHIPGCGMHFCGEGAAMGVGKK